MDGRTDGRTYGRTKILAIGWMDRRTFIPPLTDGRTDGRTDRQAEGRKVIRSEGATNGLTEGRTADGRKVIRSVGGRDKRTDEQRNRRTDARTDG